MPVYVWEGRAVSGKTVRGEMDAPNPQAVFDMLHSRRIMPHAKKIKEKGKGLGAEINIPGLSGRVKTRDVVIFTRQFATMIDAGLPILQCLDVLSRQSESPGMRKTLTSVKETVEAGGSLSDGLLKHPKVFTSLFVSMVAAGETGGILDIILQRLATYYEKMDRLKRQVKTAMIYPAVVVAAAGIVTSILLIFVIPTFAEMFATFGSALPTPTQWVINASNFAVAYGYYIFGIIIFSIIGIRRFLKTNVGKEFFHPIFLKLPIFGEIFRKIAVARVTRTLGTMITSGVPILEALLICSRTAGNRVVEKEVSKVRASISEGKTIVEPLTGSKIFPPMVVQMIGVGESTGALDAMLQKIADFYEDEVENAVNGMKQLIEPLMIIFLGGIVGALVIAMYLPIFQLGDII